jgi:hypothetical protein
VDNCISSWMKCVTENNIGKILLNVWTIIFHLEWSVLQWTLYEWYFRACGQLYCKLNEGRYSEHYMKDISQQVDNCTASWMKCITVNIIWKILHSRWTIVFHLEWSALEWTLYKIYFTAGGQFYFILNEVRYSDQYREDTSHHVDNFNSSWMKCLTVIIWKILHWKWSIVLHFELISFQWTLYGTVRTPINTT